MQSSDRQEEQKSALDVMDRELILKLARDEAGTESVELRLSLWDFGGQSVFYALHHLYLTRFAAFAVLFNMQVLFVYAWQFSSTCSYERRSFVYVHFIFC